MGGFTHLQDDAGRTKLTIRPRYGASGIEIALNESREGETPPYAYIVFRLDDADVDEVSRALVKAKQASPLVLAGDDATDDTEAIQALIDASL